MSKTPPSPPPPPPPPPPDQTGGPSSALRGYFAALRQYPAGAWRAVIACALISMVGPSTSSVVITFVLTPMSKDFGWSVSETLMAVSTVPTLAAIVTVPSASRLLDRFGIRTVSVPAMLVAGSATALVAVIPANKVLLSLLNVVSSTPASIVTMAVGLKVLSMWFPNHRGMMFAIFTALVSLSSAVASPVIQQIVANFGWRAAFVAVGGAAIVIAVPALFFLMHEPTPEQAAKLPGMQRPAMIPPQTGELPEPPPQMGERPAMAPPRKGELPEPPPLPSGELPGVPAHRAFRSRTWLVIMIILLVTAGMPATVKTIAVSMLGERGYSAELVSFTLSALSITSFVAQLGAGVILDRAKTAWVAIPLSASVVGGAVLLLFSTGSALPLFLAMCLLGVGQGVEGVMGPYLLTRYFGMRSFAMVQGVSMGLTTAFGFSLAPLAIQMVAEATGSYTNAIIAMVIAGVVACAAAFMLPRYPTDVLPDPQEMPAAPTALKSSV